MKQTTHLTGHATLEICRSRTPSIDIITGYYAGMQEVGLYIQSYVGGVHFGFFIELKNIGLRTRNQIKDRTQLPL